MKLKTLYVCQQCEQTSSKWAGRCPNCDAWNSFVEDVVNVGKPAKSASTRPSIPPQKPQALRAQPESKKRLLTGISELDQVLGGGFVEGSLTLLSGEPGIGKSTLTLQILAGLSPRRTKILYITGEESLHQVSSRAERLECDAPNLELLYGNELESLLPSIESAAPDFLVLDSIQVIASSEISGTAGSLSQVRYVTEAIMSFIKSRNIPTLLIGHVNKDGNIAGPKVLEHLVDTVLLIEGERDRELRLLRALKNRFGSVNEVGLFEMDEKGLKELKNPGERLLKNRPEGTLGSCLTLCMQGNRPLLVEVQALASKTHFGYPKRTASGFDRNRLELLIAVLQKHTNLDLSDQDIYINISEGLRINDPAADLAICLAICSSLLKKPLSPRSIALGEVSLTGDIRPSIRAKEREKAIQKLNLEAIKLEKIRDLTQKLDNKA